MDHFKRHESLNTVEEALRTNMKMGGSRAITYAGKEVIVPARDIHIAIDKFRTMGDKWRLDVMNSVNVALRRNFDRATKAGVSNEEFIMAVQDVAIWFANEVVEGRASFSVQ